MTRCYPERVQHFVAREEALQSKRPSTDSSFGARIALDVWPLGLGQRTLTVASWTSS